MRSEFVSGHFCFERRTLSNLGQEVRNANFARHQEQNRKARQVRAT